MRIETLVADLVASLDSSSVPGNRSNLLQQLQNWLQSRVGLWSTHLRHRWGLDALVALDLSRYPIDESSLDPDEELLQLKRVPPTSMELLAMRLRDIFWAGITVESETVCPRCEATQLRILQESDSHAIVFSCDLCVWSQSPQGERWRSTSALQPASRSSIEEWRNIGSTHENKP